MENLSSKSKVVWVKGLMIDCPLYSALPECPLQKYRSLPINDKFKRVDDMNEENVDAIIEHHQNCLQQREKVFLRSTDKD